MFLLPMLRLTLVTLTVVAFVSACQPSATPSTPTLAPTPPAETLDASDLELDGTVGFSHAGLSIRLPKPRGWESFDTERGIVVAEKFGTVAEHGELRGLMAYVFVTPFTELSFEASGSLDGNDAQQILSGIIADASYVGSAVVSEAQGFEWDGYAAAYYLLSDLETGLRTLVIGLSVPQSGVLLTSSLSAPEAYEQRIRDMLPTLIGGMTINTQPLDSSALNALPEPLIFP